jgi:hypothetical protein
MWSFCSPSSSVFRTEYLSAVSSVLGNIVLGSHIVSSKKVIIRSAFISGSLNSASVNKLCASPSSGSDRLISISVAEVPADVDALIASIVHVLMDGGDWSFYAISSLLILLFSACSTLTCSFKSFASSFNSVISMISSVLELVRFSCLNPSTTTISYQCSTCLFVSSVCLRCPFSSVT